MRPCECDWHEHEEFSSKKISVSRNPYFLILLPLVIHRVEFLWFCYN